MKIFRFNKIALNAVWMMSEKIISIFGLIFVTSSVAKYVGPNLFGQIALSLSIFQIVQIIAQMGGGTIIFKRLSKNLNSGVLLLNATQDQFFSDNYDMEWMVSLSAFGSFVPCALWKTTKMSSKLQKMIFVLLRSVNFYAALLSMNYLSSLTFGVGKCQLLGPDHMLLPIMNNTVH